MNLQEIEQMCVIAIKNYLRKDLTDEYIKSNYSIALKLMIQNYQNANNLTNGLNVSSISQGGQSISFNDSATLITNDIKTILPKPCVRVW